MCKLDTFEVNRMDKTMDFLKKLGVLLLILGVVGGVSAAPPVSFNLLTPENDLLIKRVAGLTFTWSASADATTYDLYVFRLSDNTRIGEVITDTGLTPVADSDDLICTAQICTFTVPGPSFANFTDGRYSWTANANNLDGATEATNGPLFFTFNTQPIQLVLMVGLRTKTRLTCPRLRHGYPPTSPAVGFAVAPGSLTRVIAALRCALTADRSRKPLIGVS